MALLDDIYFLSELTEDNMTRSIVKKLSLKIQKPGLINSVKNSETIRKCSGEILLVSYSFINSIKFINELVPNFDYVNFIDPVAYSQIDEERLLEQIKKIDELNLSQKQKELWSSKWNYYDFYRMNSFM